MVNFENNSGFAVLGARTDMTPIIAVTEKGNIDPVTLMITDTGDETNGGDNTRDRDPIIYDGPGLADPNGTETYITTLTDDNIYNPIEDDYYVGGDFAQFISIVISSGIKYRESQSFPTLDDLYISDDQPNWENPSSGTGIPTMLNLHWRQHSPYNKFCKLYNGYRRLAGCSSVAAAMIMAYNEFPTKLTVNDTLINWNIISSTPTISNFSSEPEATHIPLLLASIFWKCDRLACGEDWTLITASQIKKRFVRMGYSNVAMYMDDHFNNEMLIETLNMLRDGKPVYVSAVGRQLEPDDKVAAHSWIVDGVQEGNSTMLHCNWGWNGSSDGYFSIYNFTVHLNDASYKYSKHFRVITYDIPSEEKSRTVDF